ncbi:class I SAM-dependent DNA methyltransferase [Pseudonocardia spinosispora]|uniref:class I SAM-dependent DNA methyltransferase n=1 Tax=Pseudonocardia spinosispora TaxID=103441 RepID=UPI00041227E5|nr:class I SAM-dependent methyltransferase [Pseudonocardia spinosispora]
MSADDWLADTRHTYDADAAGYADVVRDILGGRHPHLNAALGLFADQVLAEGGGAVADIGCGPGHVTAHLHGLGVDAFGIDLSPEMIAVARSDHPGPRFEVGSMTDLDVPAASVAGLIAWWSLIHIPDGAMATVLGQFHRVLRPGGLLQVGFHVGDPSPAMDSDDPTVHGHRRRPERMADWLRDAGFTVESQWEFNMATDRPGAILFARRTGT